MPELANSSTELSTLNIHKFPSLDAYNAAVANSEIGSTDISFVEGDTIDVPLPTAQDAGNVLTAGASGTMYWGAGGGGGGGTGGSTVTAPSSTVTVGTTSTWYVAIDGASKYIQLPSSIPAGWLGTTSSVAASGNHAHGAITTGGTISTSAAIQTNDSFLIVDASVGSSIRKSTISFDTSNTTQFLRKDGTWATPSSGGGGGATELNDLADVNLFNSLASDQVLTYNGSTWMNQILGIDDLKDVSISGASDGQVLTYNGSEWVNSLPHESSSNHDLTYEVLNPTTNSLTLTFASGTRGYKYINLSNLPSAASSVLLTIVINNNAENYIMINNQAQTLKYIDFVSITYNGVTNNNVNTTAIVPEYDTWHNVESARCKEYSINIVPTINKPIITCTDTMADLSYV